ncbi:hypothetical protein CEXT_253961 [Caerostris extrusa]|uniref:Uncharacterized protein n=1 Tax=Caerostris extrusa TaxID=172846 RepID=A0AAV4XC51_CAEEX|nr:hypothetical protein CEXT_253961 [Caerostris extrusa]
MADAASICNQFFYFTNFALLCDKVAHEQPIAHRSPNRHRHLSRRGDDGSHRDDLPLSFLESGECISKMVIPLEKKKSGAGK